MFVLLDLYTSHVLLILHGGWDTITLALLYWVVIIGLPLYLLFVIVKKIVEKRN
jgi:hypothetical protein